MSTATLRTEMVRARIEPHRKHAAEAILNKLGIPPSQAINMFYAQIALLKALPFEVRIPTRTTQAAMTDARVGRVRRAKDVAALVAELDA